MDSIAAIRTDYKKHVLDEKSVDLSPIKQFSAWFDEALKCNVMEPNAMNLATVAHSGRPVNRVVLLKGISGPGLTFFTNYQSAKGKELADNPYCALTFFWPELERQVRIEGEATRVSEAESDAYFHSRPRESQMGAWASPQSTVVENRMLLEERMEKLKKKFGTDEIIPRPKQWGGYLVKPFLFEFWQGRPSRLHDRLLYTLREGNWNISRLAP